MITYISFAGGDSCFIEDYASGISEYSLVSGTTTCFSGGTNYALISSGASGNNSSTIGRNITSKTVSTVLIRFNIEADAIDDCGIVGTRNAGAFTLYFIPSREKAIDASERAYLGIGGSSYSVSTAKLSIGVNYQFELTINVASAAIAVITNLDTSAVAYTTTLPTLTKPTASSLALNIDNAPNVKRTRYTYFRIC